MKHYLLLPLTLLVLILSINSCSIDGLSDNGFDEELKTLTDLEPLSELDDISMIVSKGTSSDTDTWFVFDILNAPENSVVQNGISDGWCVEWDKAIESNNTRHDNLKLFSTLDNEKWNKMNYLLNLLDQLREEDPELTFREFQATMWSLIGIPEFDLDELEDSELPSRLRSNGTASFSREKVKQILAKVNTNGSAFEVNSGDTYAIVVESGADKQNVMIPVQMP